jgi:hypothetical protein
VIVKQTLIYFRINHAQLHVPLELLLLLENVRIAISLIVMTAKQIKLNVQNVCLHFFSKEIKNVAPLVIQDLPKILLLEYVSPVKNLIAKLAILIKLNVTFAPTHLHNIICKMRTNLVF